MGLVKYYTPYSCVSGTCVADSDMFVSSEDYLEVFGRGTYLAMPKTICAPDTSALKPSSGATEGVLD